MSGQDDRGAITSPTTKRERPVGPPPLLGSWKRLYQVLLVELMVTIVLLYALARWAA